MLLKVGEHARPSVRTQREAVRGAQGSWDEHNGLNPRRTNPSLTDFNLESQAAYLECPFPLGKLLPPKLERQVDIENHN